ncbi:MAG: hypothetical protein P8Y54_01150 [Xanthomonadales bacterium]
MKTRWLTALVVLFLGTGTALAKTTFQPFVLASVNDAPLAAQTAATRDALEAAGFSIEGEYAPLDSARVLVVTHGELLAVAAQTPRGGYAAAQRVSVAERDGKTEVAFVNPLYIQHAYRLAGDLQVVYELLSSTLGNIESYGTEDGMSASKLAKYNYKPLMEKFDDPYELGQFASHEAATAAVELGLARPDDALSEIYRIDIPGTEQVLIGVGMKAASEDDLDIDEAHQLSVVDYEGHSKVAYFPYEVLVRGREVEALHMRFRMAVHFPDLSMMGAHGFTKLMSSPGATEDALESLFATN